MAESIQHPYYDFKSLIGKGGMATVYLAEHNTLHKPVAIKVLNKEFVHNENIRKRFLAEARNMFAMSHPNVVRITDLIDQEDIVAFVMEYVEGETLKDYLEQKGKLADEKIKNLFSQMLNALGYVHEQGFIHRDIKPSNFILTSKGIVKLLDFGIAKNTDKNSAEYTQTGTTQNMGTPMYMSPEQIKSTKDVTAQSDIYSLGVVLWQMVMGTKPYDTETISTWELQTKIVNEPLPATSTKWDSLVQLATSKDLSTRYESANVFQQEISKLVSQEKHSPKPEVERKTVAEETIIDTLNTPNSEETVLIDKAVSEDQTILEEKNVAEDKTVVEKGEHLIKIKDENKLNCNAKIINKYFLKLGRMSYVGEESVPEMKLIAFSANFPKSIISKCTFFYYHDSTLRGKGDRGYAIVKDNNDDWYFIANQTGSEFSGILSFRRSEHPCITGMEITNPGKVILNVSNPTGKTEKTVLFDGGTVDYRDIKYFIYEIVLNRDITTLSDESGNEIFFCNENLLAGTFDKKKINMSLFKKYFISTYSEKRFKFGSDIPEKKIRAFSKKFDSRFISKCKFYVYSDSSVNRKGGVGYAIVEDEKKELYLLISGRKSDYSGVISFRDNGNPYITGMGSEFYWYPDSLSLEITHPSGIKENIETSTLVECDSLNKFIYEVALGQKAF
jgi:tRNA A-37 threonylcarbamoyl transferase component Bud32